MNSNNQRKLVDSLVVNSWDNLLRSHLRASAVALPTSLAAHHPEAGTLEWHL